MHWFVIRILNSGTSFSTPCVAAAAAMQLLVRPSLTPAQVERRLEKSVKNFQSNPDHYYGSGILDLTKDLGENSYVQSVISEIDNIPQEITLDAQDYVESARESYNALMDTETGLVTNYNELLKAEKKKLCHTVHLAHVGEAV